MTWSVLAQGTRAETTAAVSEQLDRCAANYTAAGDPEQQDILACKARILALIEAVQVDEGKIVRVEANGWHSWNTDKAHPLYAGFSVKVTVP